MRKINNFIETDNQVKLLFSKLIEWHTNDPSGTSSNGQLPQSIMLVKCLQLMCEGHYQPNQDALRAQTSEENPAIVIPNAQSENILDPMVAYLNSVSKLGTRVATAGAQAVASLVLEVLQGPCTGNQVHFASRTHLLEVLNCIMRSQNVNDQVEIEEVELKFTVVKIFQALIEGRHQDDPLFKKVLGMVHHDVLVEFVDSPVLKVVNRNAR
jgi:hypothetical protein